MIKNHCKVSEILADHFATTTARIGGANAQLTDIYYNYFFDHPGVQLIVKNVKNSPEAFDFELINETQVRTVLN